MRTILRSDKLCLHDDNLLLVQSISDNHQNQSTESPSWTTTHDHVTHESSSWKPITRMTPRTRTHARVSIRTSLQHGNCYQDETIVVSPPTYLSCARVSIVKTATKMKPEEWSPPRRACTSDPPSWFLQSEPIVETIEEPHTTSV